MEKYTNVPATVSTMSQKAVQAPMRQLKKSLSDEVLQDRLALARTRKGEIVRFLCTKTENWEIGLIRTARLDKRSGFIQFRIELLDYPLEDEDPQNFQNPTGEWAEEGNEEVTWPVRRTGVIYGKGDDAHELQLVGHYKALAKAPKETPAEEPVEEAKTAAAEPEVTEAPTPKESKKKSSKKGKKTTSKEAEAQAAAMADMAAEGLI